MAGEDYNRTERTLVALLAMASRNEARDLNMGSELEELILPGTTSATYDTFRRAVEYTFGVTELEVGRWTRKVPLWQIRMWLEDRGIN